MNNTLEGCIPVVRTVVPVQGASRNEVVETALDQALSLWQSGNDEQALGLLRRAVGADLRRPEPWYWMGRIHEHAKDPIKAAYCYYMANDLRRHEPSREALRRLGYLGQGDIDARA
jgi:Tfp pilus assembly protein PilF